MATRIDTPTESAGDKVHALVKAGMGSLPAVGSVAAEVFGMVVAAPYQQRQTEWMDSVGAKILEMEERQERTREELSNDPGFIDTRLHATQAAMRTSNEQKLDALRNAVTNSARPDRPDDTRRQLFVNMVDELMPWHLRVLDLLTDPRAWFQKHGRPLPQYHLVSSVARLMGDALPEIANQREFWQLLVKDLQRRGLLDEFQIEINMSGDGAFEKRGTEMGCQFLQFISDK